jgi:hypothetical protein
MSISTLANFKETRRLLEGYCSCDRIPYIRVFFIKRFSRTDHDTIFLWYGKTMGFEQSVSQAQKSGQCQVHVRYFDQMNDSDGFGGKRFSDFSNDSSKAVMVCCRSQTLFCMAQESLMGSIRKQSTTRL